MHTLTFYKGAKGRPEFATHQKLVNRVEHWYQLATVEDREAGHTWYHAAGQFCSVVARELKLPFVGVAQALAILSPQVDWDTNKRNLILLASTQDPGIKIFATERQKIKALAALGGEYQIPVTSRKIFSFADNIANPESLRVTVDRHATKVALNDRSAEESRVTDLQYRTIEKAYQTVASNHGLLPYQVQAVCWVAYKRIVGR